jgi:hypothetical protein
MDGPQDDGDYDEEDDDCDKICTVFYDVFCRYRSKLSRHRIGCTWAILAL